MVNIEFVSMPDLIPLPDMQFYAPSFEPDAKKYIFRSHLQFLCAVDWLFQKTRTTETC